MNNEYKDDSDSKPRLLDIFRDRARLLARDLQGAYLRSASLYQLDLSDVKFIGADLAKASLDGCDLRDTDFSGANLCETSLRDVNLTGARMKDCYLTGAFFSNNTILPDGVQWAQSVDPLAALANAGAKWSWRFPPAAAN